MKRTLATVAVGLLVIVATIGSANATCIPAKDFNTWDSPEYWYVFWGGGSAADSTLVTGNFWEAGNRTAANEGEYDASNWLNYFPGYGWYLQGNLGDGGVVGCPEGQLILTVTDPTPASGTHFFVTSAIEDPSARVFFHFGGADIDFLPMPSPQVIASSRTGTDVNVSLQFDDVGAAFYTRNVTTAADVIDSVVLYQAKGTNPGPAVDGWTEIGRFPYAGGAIDAEVTVDCADETLTFLAAGLSVDAFDLAHVSAAVAIECDPNLADPDDKFDIIRERGKGQKRGKPFREN